MWSSCRFLWRRIVLQCISPTVQDLPDENMCVPYCLVGSLPSQSVGCRVVFCFLFPRSSDGLELRNTFGFREIGEPDCSI